MIANMSTALANSFRAISEFQKNGINDCSLIATKCRALMCGYDRRWCDQEYVPLEVEKTYVAPLVNPDTNKTSRTFMVAGKVDVLASYHGKTCLIDHKTTSFDIESADSTFWSQLVVEGQVNQYLLLLWLSGMKADNAVWDCIRKPSIIPKKLSKAEVHSVVANQEYFDARMSIESVNAIQATERETLEAYQARLTHDCTKERPGWYYQRRSVPRLDSELIAYAKDLWDVSQEIISTRNAKRYIKSSQSCMAWGTPCSYLGICSGMDSPDSDKWTKTPQVHRELPELDGDGRNILTNTRIKTYLSCRMKHHYAFELGIERVDAEERDALFFGSLMHLALESWWKTFLPINHQNEQ